MTTGISVRARPRQLRSVLGIAVALLAGSCGLGDRQARADVIVDAVRAVDEAGTATGTISIEFVLRSTPDGQADLADGFSTEVLPVALDLGHRTAVLFAPDGTPHTLFREDQIVGRRNDALPEDARPWMRLDVEDIDEDETHVDLREGSPAQLLHVVDPLLVLDMAAGPLAGSAEPPASETVDGVVLERYRVNMDVEKTLTDTRRRYYDEDRREEREILFDLLDVEGTIHPGEVWVDEAGRLRRFLWAVELEPVRDLVIEARVDLRLDSFGEPVEVARPGEEEVLAVDGLVTFLQSVVIDPNAAAADGAVEILDDAESAT